MAKQETTEQELSHVMETREVVERVGIRSAKQSTMDKFFRKQ